MPGLAYLSMHKPKFTDTTGTIAIVAVIVVIAVSIYVIIKTRNY